MLSHGVIFAMKTTNVYCNFESSDVPVWKGDSALTPQFNQSLNYREYFSFVAS